MEPTITSILANLRQYDKDELIPNSLREHLSETERVFRSIYLSIFITFPLFITSPFASTLQKYIPGGMSPVSISLMP